MRHYTVHVDEEVAAYLQNNLFIIDVGVPFDSPGCIFNARKDDVITYQHLKAQWTYSVRRARLHPRYIAAGNELEHRPNNFLVHRRFPAVNHRAALRLGLKVLELERY